jgi:hypothetical protein
MTTCCACGCGLRVSVSGKFRKPCAKRLGVACDLHGKAKTEDQRRAPPRTSVQCDFRVLSNLQSSASPRFVSSSIGRRPLHGKSGRGSSSLANLPCSGLSFGSIRCMEVRQPSADQPQPVISNDQTPLLFFKYKIECVFLLDDRLAKFTSPTICINMIIGSLATL